MVPLSVSLYLFLSISFPPPICLLALSLALFSPSWLLPSLVRATASCISSLSLVHFQSRLFYHFFLCRLSPSLRDCVTLYVCRVLVSVCVCLSLFAFEFSLHRVRCISCLALFCTLNLSISRLSRSVCHSTFVSPLFDPTFDSALLFSSAFQKFSQ